MAEEEQTLAQLVADETPPAAAPAKVEAQADEGENEAVETEASLETEAAGEGDETGEAAAAAEIEAELEEIDLDGERLKLPKKVAEAIMAKQTFDAKMSEVEQARQTIEQERLEMQALAKRNDEDLRMEAQLASLQDLVGQYKQVDWLKLARENPDEATALKFQYEHVREQEAELRAHVQNRKSAKVQEIHTATEARIREADDWASTNIPGWNQGKDRELLDFAKSTFGYSDVELAQKIDKNLVQLLHFARIGHRVQAKATTQPAPEAKPTPPLRTVKSAKSTTGAASASSLFTAEGDSFKQAWEKNKHRTLASL